ncbi:Predicted arabinose efflux permease, MFS family [Actinacidiphila yanglinensis]|uniref:Predicted arabinose efflux permease, MFS family n=1 Tax=Actinacidiphila yanglinensis TaxID=310779 RepID=A0A1H6D3M7_9ACTN|nr:MFS transporter [Actinacidiphila yanglinensis]SEG79910.1 Predicted arabinose efflux permease, MFS family [Actinacidiphila yanglinensis]
MTTLRSRQAGLPGTFQRIWAASAVSSLGDGIYYSALPLLALTLTRNPVIFGVMEAVTLLPWLLFGLIGGALVDRWDRRRTMAIADLCRGALLVIATIAVAGGVLDIGVLIAVGFLLGIGGVLFDTAAMAYVPELLDRDPDALNRANSRLQGTQRALDGFAGPPAGSLLFTLSRAVPFAVDAVSFLFSALVIRSLPARPKKPARPRTPLLAEAWAGARYLFHHKVLLGLALRPAVGNFAFCGIGAVLALYAHNTLHLGTAGYGTFLTAEAIGGLGGTFAAGWTASRLGTGGTLTLTAVVEAASLLFVGLSANAFYAAGGFAVLGAAMGATMTLGPSVRQAIVPDELMGRVGAASRLTALSAGPFGALVGGWLAHVAGTRSPFLAGSGILLVMAVLTAPMTSNRRIDAAMAEAEGRRVSAPGDAAAAVEAGTRSAAAEDVPTPSA